MTEKKNTNAPSRIRLASMNGNEAASDTREKRTGRVLAVGRYADDNDIRSGLNNNDLIIGCSGSGKTGGYVIPNIRRCHGSLIITDTKRQLYLSLIHIYWRCSYFSPGFSGSTWCR